MRKMGWKVVSSLNFNQNLSQEFSKSIVSGSRHGTIFPK